MIRVPFLFNFASPSKYGLPLAGSTTFGTNYQVNSILAAILAASETPDVYGLTLPASGRPYRIRRVSAVGDENTRSLMPSMSDGSTVVPLSALISNGQFSGWSMQDDLGLYVPTPNQFVLSILITTTAVISGFVDWEYAN